MARRNKPFQNRVIGCVLGMAIAAIGSAWPAPKVTAANPFGSAPALSDADLSNQRGGFISPEGVRIAIGYTMETHLDGALVMRSYVTLGQSAGVVDPAAGYAGTVTLGDTRRQASFTPQASAGPGRQVFTINRPGTSLQIAAPQVSSAQRPAAPNETITQPLATTKLSVGSAYYDGMVSTSGYTGRYSGEGLDIVHQINGGIPAAVISNTSSNRTIDHSTIVNLDLSAVALPPSGTLSALNGSVMDGLGVFRSTP